LSRGDDDDVSHRDTLQFIQSINQSIMQARIYLLMKFADG